MLSVVVKLYGRVLIKRIKATTECAIGEGQCGFWQSRGCMDKVFAIRQVCEKRELSILGIYGFGEGL